MDDDGAYGERLRRTFKVSRAPSLVAKTLKNARIAVTEIRCDKANTGFSEPIPVEDAFLMTVQLRDVPAHGMFLDGRQVKTEHLAPGTVCFYDLRSSPMANSISAFHHISFYVPRAAITAIAEKEEIPAIDAFYPSPGIGADDPVLYNLVRAMRPAFRSPGLANRLFVDHLTVAATAHALRQHACADTRPDTYMKPLSRTGRTRVQEKLAEHLSGDISLEDLSGDSGMSPLALARAFESTVGQSVHVWRSDLRIDRAKRLLARGYDIENAADLLGYAHVSDFVQDFTLKTGIDPATFATR